MRQGTIVTTAATDVALSVDQAKRQLRIEPEDTDEDVHTGELCRAAHRKIENELGYPILRTTCETHLACFPRGPIWLGGGDALTISALRYIDGNGDTQTIDPADYKLNAIGRVAEVYPAPSFSWPSTQRVPSAVVIEWTAGWATAADVPEDLIHAMKLLVGHWDANREAVVVGTISTEVQAALDDILAQFRIPFVA